MTEPTYFRLDNWTHITLTGPDRKSFLHSFCTNDINRLADGDVVEAFVPDIKGRILGHMFVISLPDALHLIAVPGAGERLVPHLTKYLLGVEVDISDVTDQSAIYCIVANEGQQSLPELENLALNAAKQLEENGQALFAARVDLTNLSSTLLVGSKMEESNLSTHLEQNGVRQGTSQLFEQLRIEAGFPFAGRDVTDANIAQEAARSDRTISFTKGCYLGQEPIARLDAMGHTNKELRGLIIQGAVTSSNAVIIADEKEVGQISSYVVRDDGTTVALAVIRGKFAEPGQSLAVVTEDATLPAEVFWPNLKRE